MAVLPTAAGALPVPAGSGTPAQAPPAPAYAPKPPSHGPPAKKAGPNLVLIGAVAAAVLVVALVGAFIAFNQKPGSTGGTPTPATTSTPTLGPCDFLKPGVAPAANSSGTCGLKLGSQVQADSFAGLTALPADLAGVAIDANGVARGKATIPVSGGFAALSTNARGAAVGVSSGPTPADLVVIADFTPTTGGDANIGISARCGASDCVLVYVSPKGTAWIMQRTGGGALSQKFKDIAQVQQNQPNRLVVALHGSQVQSWLNGNLISTVQVDVSNPGTVGFFDSNQDTTPSATNLSGLYVFAAA
jgi:hypothetical protein